MRILSFGSLNIDHVYRVPHIVRPGETLACRSLEVFAGGKGANQSVALARAGARVFHAGRVGEDGRWLLRRLADAGADVEHALVDPDTRTGNAIIQVDDAAENSIVLFPGANHRITRQQIDDTLSRFSEGDILLLQHEINETPYLITEAKIRGLTVAFNPAPMTPAVRDYPLGDVDILIVNETEGRALTGRRSEDEIIEALPAWENVLTLGPQGVRYRGKQRLMVPGVKVEAVDTTAAGDTFIGYFLAGRATGLGIKAALQRACRAAAMCCTRPGAADSIPTAAEVDAAD
jgi:ribokinase